MSKTPLSSAYPFVALGIIIIMASGAWLFGEPIAPMKLVGGGLIISRILPVARAA
ncbi:MAG: hypothetical protein N2444_09455 [Methylocystis sp.]|nr:hypothetical protein [Methylocystis sp.]